MSSLQVVGRERTNLRMKRAFENHHLIFPKQFYQMQAMYSNTWAYVSHSHSKHHIPQTCPGGQSMLCGHFNPAMLKPFFKPHFSYIHNICKLYFFFFLMGLHQLPFPNFMQKSCPIWCTVKQAITPRIPMCARQCSVLSRFSKPRLVHFSFNLFLIGKVILVRDKNASSIEV